MSGIALNIRSEEIDKLFADTQELSVALSADDVKLVMGRAVQQVIKSHFEELAGDAVHHKTASALGAERTGLYEEAARNTQQPQIEAGGVSISINQVGIAQRLFGGPIEPVNAKFLAIPARTESYGKRPREFENLRFILFPSGAGALVEKDGGKGSDVGGLVYFWLVKEVTQRPDPTVLPEDAAMLEPAMTAASDYIDRLWSRS